LIPTAVEYEEANICDLVWWNDTDYRLFKQDAVQELKTFLIHRPNLDAKEAIKVLYQSKFDNLGFYRQLEL
jgi:phage pi2 protein 07